MENIYAPAITLELCSYKREQKNAVYASYFLKAYRNLIILAFVYYQLTF